MPPPLNSPLVSVVVPVFQNATSLADLHERLRQVTAGRPEARWEFVFVDDGSTDRSLAVLEDLQRLDGRIRIVRLSRNFGSQAAIVAGWSQARGDAMAVIAADLQDPPEILVPLVAAWQQGAKAVLAVRSRRDDPWPAKLGAALFYAFFRRLALAGMPVGGFDCCLLDRQLVERLVALRRPCYLAGEIIWLGFEPVLISYNRGKRLARYGRSMWTLGKRMRLAADAIWTFSRAPLRIVQAIGLLLSLLAVAGALLSLFAFSPAHRDRNLLLAAITGFSGLQLLATSWVGSSVWACQQSLLDRPAFVIDRVIEADVQNRRAA
ncbi:MAG TPA: glycosyltransferase family 2 protein [Pirellulales bacterium]|jgi:dolichol-phosphate mannosyltransferase|nr:glycosyltransferase family 2 protein [Pirellulales bacterium]